MYVLVVHLLLDPVHGVKFVGGVRESRRSLRSISLWVKHRIWSSDYKHLNSEFETGFFLKKTEYIFEFCALENPRMHRDLVRDQVSLVKFLC
jgi:hypothetical protein